MIIGQVKGNVISTKKLDTLRGCKFLKVQPVGSEKILIAVDKVGAGNGDMVLVTTGRNAKYAFEGKKVPTDAVVVGIID